MHHEYTLTILKYLWLFYLKYVSFATEHLPVFALRDDSVVEIQGESSGVHKAVELIATHLRKFLVDRSIVGVFETQARVFLKLKSI